MRLIFFLLILVNVALLVWRFAVGLPEHYTGAANAPANSSAQQGPKLRLLGEPLAPGDSSSPPLPAQCKMAGPFASVKEANAFEQRLAALDVSASVTTLRRSSGEGYWVHFPPEQSIAQAKKRLAQLHDQGIDSYVIADGELKNSISVGLFSEQSAADARVAELAALGYATSVHAIDRFQEEIWVALAKGEGQKIAASAWKPSSKTIFR